ncbi:MAG: hypothetical protein EOO61_08745, partial [Hymenobacter sp.]
KKTTAQNHEWYYTWNAAGHLAEVVRPDGGIVRFTYDALGRRVSKSYNGIVTCWLWDGNVPLHEWSEQELSSTTPGSLVTWLFEENSFAPVGKLTANGSYSVVCDHLGTPLTLYNEQGNPTWQAQFDSYGAIRQGLGQAQDCPFRYQGQYEDVETGLYYNRFRYYDSETGQYISQDPIGLLGGFSAYGYVTDPLVYTDALGLSQTYWLEKALNTAGRPLQPGQTAHHIVQINNPSKYAQASRDLLARHGLHPDVAANGARLWGTHPNQTALANHPSRITARATGNYHAGPHIHSPTNDKLVFRTLRQAEKKGLNIESTLEDIGRKMESGNWKKGYKGCGHK